MAREIRDLTIVVPSTGKTISSAELSEDTTARELAAVLAQKMHLPRCDPRSAASEFLARLGQLLDENGKLVKLLSDRLGLGISANSDRLNIEEDITPQTFIKLLAGDREILTCLAREQSWPAPTRGNGWLTRELSGKRLLPHQSLGSAGIEDGEVLIFDYELTAGGSIRFYSNGNLKEIEFEPEEAHSIIEVLGELQRIREELMIDSSASVSARIQDVRNSTVIISGRDSTRTSSQCDSEPERPKATRKKKTPPGSNISVKAQDFVVSGTNVTFGGGTITNVNLGGSEPPTGDVAAFDRSVINDDREASLRRQLALHRKNLSRLEEQLAEYSSMDAPLHLLNRIDYERAEIQRLTRSLDKYQEG